MFCPVQLCLSPFVRSIKEVENMDNTPKCEKLMKGRDGFVVRTSYIVMIKQDHNMSDIVSVAQVCQLKSKHHAHYSLDANYLNSIK